MNCYVNGSENYKKSQKKSSDYVFSGTRAKNGGIAYIYIHICIYIYMVKSKKWCPNGLFGNTIVQTPAIMFLFFLLYPPTLGLSGEQYFCIRRSVNKFSTVQKPSFLGLF